MSVVTFMIMASRVTVAGTNIEEKVALYYGKGGELALDVEIALKRLNISYINLDEADIIEGRLSNYSILIIPGGRTQLLYSALKEEGLKNIKEYVKNGGGYIGICAGAYLAAPLVNIPGTPPGLGIIDIENKRISDYGIRSIEIKNEHFIIKGYSNRISIYYQNGPLMMPKNSDISVLATYDEEKFAAIVVSKYGKGDVVLFSPHPEGSSKHNVDPEKIGTLKLLGNSIEFLLKR